MRSKRLSPKKQFFATESLRAQQNTEREIRNSKETLEHHLRFSSFELRISILVSLCGSVVSCDFGIQIGIGIGIGSPIGFDCDPDTDTDFDTDFDTDGLGSPGSSPFPALLPAASFKWSAILAKHKVLLHPPAALAQAVGDALGQRSREVGWQAGEGFV